MGEEQKKAQILQWHPAFYAGIQIELSGEEGRLEFESEHQLGTKPKEIDVLIINKTPEKEIRKNIGQIFRTHNIVEYKSPEDYLSIDDYYKVLGYACFYKADTPRSDAIKASEITISLVCRKQPRKLIRHLTDVRHLCLKEQEKGIYYIGGEVFPVQIICASKLSPESNLWLKGLTNDLEQGEMVDCLLREYRRHQRNGRYKSVMNLIVRANREVFKEGKEMCEALRELFKDELEVGIAAGIEERLPKVVEERVAEARQEVRREGINALIADNMEEGFSASRILEKLVKRFGLTPGEAQGYLEQFTAG